MGFDFVARGAQMTAAESPAQRTRGSIEYEVDPDGAERLRIIDRSAVPSLSHGICGRCEAALVG